MGDLGNALECYDRSLEISPINMEAWYRRGVVLYDLKIFPASIESYDKAIEIDENYAEACKW